MVQLEGGRVACSREKLGAWESPCHEQGRRQLCPVRGVFGGSLEAVVGSRASEREGIWGRATGKAPPGRLGL